MISTLPNILHLSSNINLSFPVQCCGNCGATKDLQVIEQDTYFTKYLPIYGDLAFALPLPFCSKCTATAKRRPKKVLHYVLRFLLAFTLTASAFIITNRYLVDLSTLGNNIIPIYLIIAITVATGRASLTKPRSKQSIYFQPVRVINVIQQTPIAPITNMGFMFTSNMQRSLLQ